jgi:hypothetical protein
MKEDGAPSRSSNSSPCQFLPISASQDADQKRRSRRVGAAWHGMALSFF